MPVSLSRRLACVLLLGLAALVPARAEPSRTPMWHYDTAGAIWSPPVVADGVLYVGSDDRRLHAVDLRQRRARWTYLTGAAVRSRPLVVGDRVLVAGDDGWLHAVDRATGRPVWKFDLLSRGLSRRPPSADHAFYDFLQSSPVSDGTVVYVGSLAGHLFAVRLADGQAVWKVSTGAELRATPLLVDGRVVIGGWDGQVYAVDARSGQVQWTHKAEGIVQGTAAAVDGRVLVGSRAAKLFALDLATGRPAWTHTYADGSWIESAATAAPGRFYVGSSDALKLSAFDAATGRELWAYATGGWAWAQPVVSGGTVYIGALSAHPYYMPGVTLRPGFHAVDAETGRVRWTWVPRPARGFVTGGVAVAPAVADGVVYVAGVDGRVVALRE